MIGIVGGMGPYSGIDLLKKVFDNTLATSDQEHLDAVLISASSKIGDRTEYLMGNLKENPAFAIAELILKLQDVGATVVGIPCNTAHSKEIFCVIQSQLEESGSLVLLLNMIEETVAFIAVNHPDINRVGVLLTTGAYQSSVYTNALQPKGYEVILPSPDMQNDFIQPAIYHPVYGIKTQSDPIHPQARKNLSEGLSFLKEKGAQAVILGCTEMPLAITEKEIEEMLIIDPTEVLARALIRSTDPDKLKPI